jgi:hypothetical protein
MSLERYPGDVTLGKRVASGKVTSGTWADFYRTDGTKQGLYKITVQGLEFEPSIVHFYDDVNPTYFYGAYNKNQKDQGYNLFTMQNSGYALRITGNAYVNNTGFSFGYGADNKVVNWIAYE